MHSTGRAILSSYSQLPDQEPSGECICGRDMRVCVRAQIRCESRGERVRSQGQWRERMYSNSLCAGAVLSTLIRLDLLYLLQIGNGSLVHLLEPEDKPQKFA